MKLWWNCMYFSHACCDKYSVTKFGLPQSVLYLFKGYNNRTGFEAFEVRFYCMDEKFPLKLFHLYIETNKAYFEKKRFWTETSESRLLYKVWTDMTSSALETFPSCFLLSLRMLTLASLECQWSPLKVIYDVICDGLWYLRALQMTVPQEGDATRPASNSYAYMCRETGGELLYPKQTFTRL